MKNIFLTDNKSNCESNKFTIKDTLVEKVDKNESIINWELHQKLMEKKYGKKPIQTTYNFKK
jgi:hypothetical protein